MQMMQWGAADAARYYGVQLSADGSAFLVVDFIPQAYVVLTDSHSIDCELSQRCTRSPRSLRFISFDVVVRESVFASYSELTYSFSILLQLENVSLSYARCFLAT